MLRIHLKKELNKNFLNKLYNEKVIILIDEFDFPLINTYNNK